MLPSIFISHDHAAVYIDDLSRDIGRLIRCKEKNGVRHVLWLSHLSKRDVSESLFLDGFRQVRSHVRADEARRDDVDRDAARGEFLRHGLGKADDARLCRRIIRLPMRPARFFIMSLETAFVQ